ncbi:MAG: glutamate--tRNA ligase, partial [Eggerthellaceae bacterium]
EKLSFIFDGPVVHLDEKSVQKTLLKEGCRAEEVLRAVRDILADESIPWECDPLQDTCRELTEKLDLKAKLVFQPIRVAVTGSQVSPPLFESIELMKRSDVVARLDYTLSEVFGA